MKHSLDREKKKGNGPSKQLKQRKCIHDRLLCRMHHINKMRCWHFMVRNKTKTQPKEWTHNTAKHVYKMSVILCYFFFFFFFLDGKGLKGDAREHVLHVLKSLALLGRFAKHRCYYTYTHTVIFYLWRSNKCNKVTHHIVFTYKSSNINICVCCVCIIFWFVIIEIWNEQMKE